jgi:hypothetical protein
MAWDHALKTQSSQNIYHFIVDFSVKYAIYIVEQEAIKASARRGLLLSRRHNIAEATPPVRNKKEEQETDHSNPL